MPPNVVLTPLALLTAPRDRAPVTGIEDTNEEAMLQTPRASISWVASIVLPSAGEDRSDDRRSTLILFTVATATDSSNDTCPVAVEKRSGRTKWFKEIPKAKVDI